MGARRKIRFCDAARATASPAGVRINLVRSTRDATRNAVTARRRGFSGWQIGSRGDGSRSRMCTRGININLRFHLLLLRMYERKLFNKKTSPRVLHSSSSSSSFVDATQSRIIIYSPSRLPSDDIFVRDHTRNTSYPPPLDSD